MFTDRTDEEFTALLGIKNIPVNEPSVPVSTEVDQFRLKDANWVSRLNPIKDQGSCGSCWAFAAHGAHEACYKIVKGATVSLSEQDLVDCSRSYGNQGCNGGWYFYAWDYIKTKGGVALASAYGYTGRDDACKNVARGNGITSYTKIAGSNAAFETAINARPIAVAVDATNWSSYSSGVFSNCATNINHAVVAVGYTSGSHWLIRNSWGTRWGESGHMRLKQGNTCGVLGYGYTVN